MSFGAKAGLLTVARGLRNGVGDIFAVFYTGF